MLKVSRGAWLVVAPALGLGIAVLTNGAPIGVPEGIASDFLDLAIVGEPTRDWVADTGAQLDALLANTLGVEGPPPAGPRVPGRWTSMSG